MLEPEILDALAFGFLAATQGLPSLAPDTLVSGEKDFVMASATFQLEGTTIAVRDRSKITRDVRNCVKRKLAHVDTTPASIWPKPHDWVLPANEIADCIGQKYSKPDHAQLVKLLVGMHAKRREEIIPELAGVVG